MDNVLEHLDDVISVIEELHRVLVVGGHATIIVPYAKSDGAFVDPTHKHFFTERSFAYFDGKSEYSYYSKVRFAVAVQFASHSITRKQKLRNLLPFRSLLRYFLMNMYDALTITLTKLD